MSIKKIRLSTVICAIFLLLLAISALYPVVFMLLSSLKTKIEYFQNPFGLPIAVNLKNYNSLFKLYGVMTSVTNSFITTTISIVLTGFLASLISFPLAKLRFSGRETAFRFFTAFMLVPVIVLMLPMYLIFAKLELVNSYASVIIYWVAIDLPYGIYMITSNLRAIPNDIIEAAKIDGSSLFGIYWRIILPLGRPIIFTMVIVYFMWNWNDLLMPMLLLQEESKTTLTVAVATILGKYFSDIPLLTAGLIINSLPTILVYLIFQKYVIKGVTMGAVK